MDAIDRDAYHRAHRGRDDRAPTFDAPDDDHNAHHRRAHRGRDNRAPTVDVSDDDIMVRIIARIVGATPRAVGSIMWAMGSIGRARGSTPQAAALIMWARGSIMCPTGLIRRTLGSIRGSIMYGRGIAASAIHMSTRRRAVFIFI